MTGVTSGAGTAYPSGAPEFTTGFSGVRVTWSLVLYVYFVDRCWSFLAFVLFLMAIVLSVLRYTDSDYPFGIFKLFFHMDYYPQIFVVWKQELPKFFCMYINIYLMQTLLLYSLYLHMYMHNVLYMYSVKNMYIINVLFSEKFSNSLINWTFLHHC